MQPGLWARAGAFAPLFLVIAAQAQVPIVDLGLPGGAANSSGIAINNSGVIIVRTNNDSLSWLRAPDGTYTPPGVPSGYSRTALNAINDAGDAVGSVGTASIERAAIRAASGDWTLPLPDNTGYAASINNAGQVVGTRTDLNPTRGFLYEPGVGVTLIPPPPGASSQSPSSPVAVNSQGEVAGNASMDSGIPGQGFGRAFRYSLAGGSIMLPTVGADPTEVGDINSAGVIVGYVGGGGSSIRPVKWLADNTLVELVPPSPSGFVVAQAINSLGDIVGSGFIAGPRAILWAEDFGSIDLNNLMAPEDRMHWELRLALDINDHRQIVGLGRFDPDGPGGPAPAVSHGYLMNLPPIPEPVLGTLYVTASCLLRRRR